MRNLEQIRASHALEFYANNGSTALHGEEQGDVIRGLPALVIGNGLLATLAFAKMKGKGFATYANAIASYLASPAPQGPAVVSATARDVDGLLRYLSAADSLVLQHATAETLAYLAYLKRFAPRS